MEEAPFEASEPEDVATENVEDAALETDDEKNDNLAAPDAITSSELYLASEPSSREANLLNLQVKLSCIHEVQVF